VPLLPSRSTAAACALALGLPLGAGVLASVPAAAVPTPALATASPASADRGVAPAWAEARRAAEAALERAQDQLRARAPGAAQTAPATRPGDERADLTLTLRDLRAGLPHLAPEDRVAARGVLARPTDGNRDPNLDGYTATPRKSCTPHLCIWYVDQDGNADAVAPTDDDANGRPDQVDLTREVMTEVWDRVVTQGGYRAPLPDGRGGDDRLDIFLADIGDEGLFGYCAPERDGPGRTAAGYCVLDNDYRPGQYGTTQTPQDNLRVTAAHEFFHTVQFAYDVGEDDWFMEGTAMWIEDEIFDDVNDNVRYLQGSQLTAPTRPLDRPAPGLGGPYVSWIFWRYLSETFPATGESGLPLVVRATWQRAQAYTSKLPSTYSMKAVHRALSARGSKLGTAFARFGDANRYSRKFYSEGAEQQYPVAPAVASYTLATDRLRISEKVATMAHMTNYTIVFTPDQDLAGADWRIRVPVNMPNTARGSRAHLTVVRTDGTRERTAIELNSYGNGAGTAPFRRGVVARVELTLTNAGQHYRCNQGTSLSCQGRSLDDGLRSYFRAGISRP
jgi:hypothetical protein